MNDYRDFDYTKNTLSCVLEDVKRADNALTSFVVFDYFQFNPGQIAEIRKISYQIVDKISDLASRCNDGLPLGHFNVGDALPDLGDSHEICKLLMSFYADDSYFIKSAYLDLINIIIVSASDLNCYDVSVLLANLAPDRCGMDLAVKFIASIYVYIELNGVMNELKEWFKENSDSVCRHFVTVEDIEKGNAELRNYKYYLKEDLAYGRFQRALKKARTA